MKRPLNKRKHWQLNEYIKAPEVRVLDHLGKQVGVMKLPDALKKAKEAKMDLIEIVPRAKPPVVKIQDFGKFRYQEEKKERKQKQKTKVADLKEVRFSPFIGGGDFDTRMRRVKKFLADKHKVKIVVKFKGRQMGSKGHGYKVCDRVLDEVGRETVNIDMEPKFLGRHLTMVISPMSQQKILERKESRGSKAQRDNKPE